jgi:hypothetical protein
MNSAYLRPVQERICHAEHVLSAQPVVLGRRRLRSSLTRKHGSCVDNVPVWEVSQGDASV